MICPNLELQFKTNIHQKYRESAIEVEVENDSIHFIICGNRWIPKFR